MKKYTIPTIAAVITFMAFFALTSFKQSKQDKNATTLDYTPPKVTEIARHNASIPFTAQWAAWTFTYDRVEYIIVRDNRGMQIIKHK